MSECFTVPAHCGRWAGYRLKVRSVEIHAAADGEATHSVSQHQLMVQRRHAFPAIDTRSVADDNRKVPNGAVMTVVTMGKETNMPTSRIALITGANQGVGKQVAKELVAAGVTVLLGSRDLARGEVAAAEIGDGATAIQIDVTDAASIAAAADRIENEFGRLDLLVNNAGISNNRSAGFDMATYRDGSKASTASLEEIRAVWEVNVFGVLAVYQAMLPLLRKSSDARIVNVSSGVGSLAANADPDYQYHSMYGPVYPASKTAENAMTLAMMVELESTDIKINLVSPAFTSTALNNFAGTESIEDGSREVVRVALLGPEGPTGTFTRWENTTIPW